MNIVPEDTPAAAALREELSAKRGGVHLEVGRFVPADSSPEADVAAGARGFRPPPGWAALPPEAALAFIVRALSSRADEEAPAMARVEVDALAVRVRSLFSAHALYFTTGEPSSGAAGDADPEAASSLFVIDGERAGLFWVEREG